MTNLPASLTRTVTAAELFELAAELAAEQAENALTDAELEADARRWERFELQALRAESA